MENKLLLHVFYLELQGSSYLLQTNTHNILFDLSHGTTGIQRVINYLDNLEISRIDVLVITHPHIDHVGGIPGNGLELYLQKYTIGEIWYNGWPHPTWYDGVSQSPVPATSYTSTVNLFNQLFPDGFATASDRNTYPTISGDCITTYREPKRGDIFTFGDLTLKVLHPSRPFPDYSPDTITSPTENRHSLVIQAIYKGKKLMLTGDLLSGTYGETEIRGAFSANELKSDILYLGHHGYDSSNDTAWLNVVNPRMATVQIRNPAYPSLRIKNELISRGIPLYDPSVIQKGYVFEVSESGIVVKTEDGEIPDPDAMQKVRFAQNIGGNIQKLKIIKNEGGELIHYKAVRL